MLSSVMKECLRHELELHDGCHDLPLCLYLTVVAACYISDTDFEEDVWEESRVFLLDEIMVSCILKGALEVEGINEEGELLYQITEWGEKQVEKRGENEQEV